MIWAFFSLLLFLGGGKCISGGEDFLLLSSFQHEAGCLSPLFHLPFPFSLFLLFYFICFIWVPLYLIAALVDLLFLSF